MILPFFSIYWGQEFGQKLALTCHCSHLVKSPTAYRYALYLATSWAAVNATTIARLSKNPKFGLFLVFDDL